MTGVLRSVVSTIRINKRELIYNDICGKRQEIQKQSWLLVIGSIGGNCSCKNKYCVIKKYNRKGCRDKNQQRVRKKNLD